MLSICVSKEAQEGVFKNKQVCNVLILNRFFSFKIYKSFE